MNYGMPLLPLDHPMPMVAVGNVMLRPEIDADGGIVADGHTAEIFREQARPYLENGWSIQDQKMMNALAARGATIDDEEERWRDGISMGVTYMMLVALVQRRPELASWKSAMKLVANIRKDTELPASHGYLSKVKTRYLSVAHLWAARLLQNRFESVDESNIDGAFDLFLLDAEKLRQIGRNFVPDRDKAGPLLDGNEWRIPDDWQPRTWQVALAPFDILLVPVLPDDVDNILKPTGRPRNPVQVSQ